VASNEAVAAALKMVAKSYPGRFEADGDTARIWARLLADLDDAPLLAAAAHHASQSKWPPSVAELREAAFDIMRGEVAPPTPGEAWGAVVKAIMQSSSRRPQEARATLGETTWRCIEAMGGWRDLCLSEEPMVDRAHFLRIYEQVQARDKAERRTLPEVRALAARYAAGLPAGDGPRALPDGLADAGALASCMAGRGGGERARPPRARLAAPGVEDSLQDCEV